jgi:hypothetical protein
MKQWTNELNRDFSKENVQMDKKHMRKCSTSLTINERKLKTILKFHLTPVRIAFFKNANNNKCLQGCGGKGTLILVIGNVS